MALTLSDLFPDLLRAIVCFAPESLGALAFVNQTMYAALLGPDVEPNEAHWRAFVTQRRWPAYAHIEVSGDKTWRDLARGWRELTPWHFLHVRAPYWVACGHGRYNFCCCNEDDVVAYRDNYTRIRELPTHYVDDRFMFESIEWPGKKWSWNSSSNRVYCFYGACVAAPESDPITLRDPSIAIFVTFI